METVLAVVVAALFAAGLYTILRRSIVRLAIGLVLLGHAANLLIFTAAGLERDRPPILPPPPAAVAPGPTADPEPGSAAVDPAPAEVVDPLPQALVLTAIVIGFGVLSYALVLVHRVYGLTRTDDVDDLIASDRLPEKGP